MRILIGLFLASAALVPAQVRTGPPSPATALPASTLAHIEITGAPCAAAGTNLAIVRLLREPEVRAFLEPLEEKVAQLRGETDSHLEQMNLTLDQCLLLLQGRITASFAGMVPVETDGGETAMVPDIVLTWSFSHAKDVGARACDVLERILVDTVGAPEEITVGGVAAKTLVLPEGPPVTWVIVADTLIVGTWTPTLEQVVSALQKKGGDPAASLAGKASYQSVMKRVARPDSVITIYADVEGLLDTFAPMLPGPFSIILGSLGLDQIRAIGFGTDLEGSAVRDRTFALIPERKGIFAQSVGKRTQADRILPRDTPFFSSTNVSLVGWWDLLVGLAETMGEDAQAGLARVEQRLGLNIRNDLLAHLGPEITAFASLPPQGLIPEIGLIVQVGDEARFEANFRRLLAATLPDVEIRTVKFDDTTIHYADTTQLSSSNRAPALRPSWTYLEGRVVVTLWPQAAKNLIRGLRQGQPRLVDHPDYAARLEELAESLVEDLPEAGITEAGLPEAGNAGISYLDLKRVVGFLLDNGVPLAQSLIPDSPRLPVRMEWAAFPQTETITRHLTGIAGLSTWVEDGVLSEVSSPTGILPVYFLAGAGTASAMWMRARSDEVGEGLAASHFQRVYTDLASLQSTVLRFQLAEARLPNDAEWPDFLLQGSKNHPDPYIEITPGGLLDPWGNPYRYKRTGPRSFKVLSFGADGVPGGEGDDGDIMLEH
jgi:hypothetical protein